MNDLPRRPGGGIVAVFRRHYVQFFKFGIVGVLNTVIFLAIYYLCLAVDPGLYLLGNFLGWTLSVGNSFFLNRRYVFTDNRPPVLPALAKTYFAYGGTFLLSSFLLYAQVQWLGVPETLAPYASLAVTVPLNFFINRNWAFR